MNVRILGFFVFLSLAHVASAQDHLIPDADVLVDPGTYRIKVGQVLNRAFEKEVTSRVIVLPSFRVEYAVGLRTTKEGVEAFVLKATSSIWDVETLNMYEEGRLHVVDQQGKTIPFEQDESYQELKKTTPSDHRKIKTNLQTRSIPKNLAAKIDALWQALLLSVRYPTKLIAGCDGEFYYFSARLQGGGQLSGHIWSPEPESKTGRLVELADTLADYASGKADLKKLSDKLEKAEKP